MKTALYFVLALCLALSLSSCSAPAVKPGTPALSSAAPIEAAEIVTFTDPVLEGMVRGAMGKPTGSITVQEAEAVTRLGLSNEWRRYTSQDA